MVFNFILNFDHGGLHPNRMVSDLVKDHPFNWDVCLPAKVFSLCFKEHPKTKQRPFSLLCCKGPQPVTTPRDLSVSLLCSYSLTLIIMDCITIEWVHFCLSFLYFLQFSPAELRESSFAIQSNQEGGQDSDPQGECNSCTIAGIFLPL